MPEHAAMRAPALLIPLLAALGSGASAADVYGGSPMLGQIGGTNLSSDLRQQLGADWGFHAGLATLVAESGVLGMPSLDLDARYAPCPDGDLLSFETYYAERALVGGGRWWLGAGFGANWMKLSLKGVAPLNDDREERKWGLGAKGMIGMLLTNRAFIEATYHYTPRLLDADTTSISVGLGYWF
jgi:hypothetical protein